MKLITKIISTGLYSGLAPFAPGTLGSLTYCLIFIISINNLAFTEFSLLIIALGVSTCGYLFSKAYIADKSNKEHSDPKEVVIDEWAGMAVALIPVLSAKEPFIAIVVAFLLFRLFDIWKPWPISKVEKLPGALGIMADDILAGLIAAVLMKIVILNGLI